MKSLSTSNSLFSTMRKMKTSKSKSRQMFDDLPEEVMAEILCRLPINSILKCTLVCKSWYSVIKNPNFISTHLYKTLSSNKKPQLLLHRFSTFSVDDQYYLRFDNKDLGEYMPLHPPFDPSDKFQFAGSCNGLICLFRDDFAYRRYGYRFILWNPSIRKSLSLPLPRFIFTNLYGPVKNFIGFGFDSRTHDYKVLRILNPPVEQGIHFRTELYSLNANSWKNITDITPKYGVDSYVTPAFANGALHWTVTDWKNVERKTFIMVFDVRDEVFREIFLPECLVNAYSSDLTVKVFGKSSIAIIHKSDSYESNIWLMKEYGVVASWVKLATVGKRWRGMSKVLGFRNNGEVLLEFSRGTHGRIASQNLKSKRIKNLIVPDKDGWSKIHSYVESLVLLDKGNYAGG